MSNIYRELNKSAKDAIMEDLKTIESADDIGRNHTVGEIDFKSSGRKIGSARLGGY